MPVPGYEGWGALGELAAGKVGTPGVYEDALKEGYSADKALQDARRARSLALIDAARHESRRALTPELLQRAMAGDAGAYAELGASALGSNQTINLGQLGDAQRPHFVQNVNAAQHAMESGDAAGYNRFNAAALGEGYQPTRVLGGAYVPDGMTMDAIHAVPTPEVLSRIERDEAMTAQGQQRTDAYVAKQGRAPVRATSGAAVDADMLAQARAAIAAGASVEAVRQRLKDRGYGNLAGKL